MFIYSAWEKGELMGDCLEAGYITGYAFRQVADGCVSLSSLQSTTFQFEHS